jgi:hypothetical protein
VSEREIRVPFFLKDGTLSTDTKKPSVYPPPRRVEWEYWFSPMTGRARFGYRHVYDWRAERDRVERSAAMGRTT